MSPDEIAVLYCSSTHANEPENIADCADEIRAFAAAMVAGERESCAQICEEAGKSCDPSVEAMALGMVTERIRARGR